jgi:hypothetical protein
MVHEYTLFEHGLRMADRVRMGAYTEAPRLARKPGSVVMDIGTGAGIFAPLACRLGARRVYAIEPHDVSHVARELAAANGDAGRIEFLPDVSTRVAVAERADVIIANVRGPLPARQVPTLADEVPLLDAGWSELPAFEQRLGMIAGALLAYREFEPRMIRYGEPAEHLGR